MDSFSEMNQRPHCALPFFYSCFEHLSLSPYRRHTRHSPEVGNTAILNFSFLLKDTKTDDYFVRSRLFCEYVATDCIVTRICKCSNNVRSAFQIRERKRQGTRSTQFAIHFACFPSRAVLRLVWHPHAPSAQGGTVLLPRLSVPGI